jgi:hypothetical protein
VVALAVAGTLVAAAAALVGLTRGRLGLPAHTPATATSGADWPDGSQ